VNAPAMMQVEVDVVQLIADLRTWGWRDQKIEVACGFSAGYVAKLCAGPRPERPYQLVARLHNFWVSEGERAGVFAVRQSLVETST
jgi:hypothetical protein